MTKIQNPKLEVSVIDYCNLGFICNLVLVICNFIKSWATAFEGISARVQT